MSVTVIRPDRHVVKDTPAARLFRRRLKCPDILTFFNVETCQWILAYWVVRGRGMVEEIEDLGPTCELVCSDFVNAICQCWGPVDFRKKRQLILGRQRDRIRRQEEDIMEDQKRYDWAKKKLEHRAPVPYAFYSPMSGGEVV